ncbi:sensor histidine kinase, partial [Blautia wexlerae]
MGRVKRSNALSRIFMRYVLVMLGSLVGLVIVAYLLLYLLISVGCIYPANYAEQKINEAYDTILHADKVIAEMIPALCNYVIFSEKGEEIGGNLPEQYEQIAWNVAKYGTASGKYFYKVISRENEYVVLQYRLTPQYHSAFLREHFIGPQNVMSIMAVIGAIAIIIIPSICFGKRIKKQMQP